MKALAAAREKLDDQVSTEPPSLEQQQADGLAIISETALHHALDPSAPRERY